MKAPFADAKTWVRIILKALVMLLIFNIFFIAVQPLDVLLPLSPYGRIVPYRTRLIYPFSGDISPQFAPVETLLGAHEIAQAKASDEFRVILLGDSGINGFGNPDQGTISGYLSATGLSIGSKRVRAYNLAYLNTFASVDLLITDAAAPYQPDLILWFVGPKHFSNKMPYPLLRYNQPRLARLTKAFHLDDINARTYGNYADNWWDRSVWGQRASLYQWLFFQTSILKPPVWNRVPSTILTEPLPDKPLIAANDPEFAPMPNPAWDYLLVMQKVSHSPVLIVNEPILVETRSSLNYDPTYSREFYDSYRSSFNRFCAQHQLWCLDLWNLVPESEYTDSPLHRTDKGNSIIAERVAQIISAHLEPEQVF